MQASTFTVKGNIGFGLQNRRILQGVSDFRSRNLARKSLRMTARNSCFGVTVDSASMGIELGRARRTVQSVFGSSAKARSDRVRASGEDIEDAAPLTVQGQSSGSVLPYVGIACLGAVLFGYHLGVVNGALEYLAKDLGIAENAVIQGWIVSTVLAGAFVGSFTGGSLADKFGRTKTFILDAIPLAVGAFLCTTAQSVQAMIIGRLLTGIGIGISSAIVPLYISEVYIILKVKPFRHYLKGFTFIFIASNKLSVIRSHPRKFAAHLELVNQLFICIGILAALVAGLPLSGNPLWWRTMFGIALIPSVLLALGMAFSPESPRWLYQQGRTSEAETSIKRLYGKERVAEVMGDLEAASQGSSEPDAGWLDLFSSRYWKVVSIGAAMFLFQQLAGINAVVYYSTAVFRSAGISSDVAASALVGAANVFGTMVASSLMDKQGRKSLLLISFTGMAASMILLSLSFTWKVLTPYSGTLAVLGTVLYVLSFSLGAGPVPALLLPEIFASRIRAKAVALSLGMHWITNFFIGLYFLSVVTKFGISTVYLGFASVCLLAVVYIAGNVVETKGRSLEEIERELSAAI
ncbi:unnamed protein product [Withania somnifera]